MCRYIGFEYFLTNFTNNYHIHVTSTVADGKVKTSGADDLETVTFTTYYQFFIFINSCNRTHFYNFFRDPFNHLRRRIRGSKKFTPDVDLFNRGFGGGYHGILFSQDPYYFFGRGYRQQWLLEIAITLRLGYNRLLWQKRATGVFFYSNVLFVKTKTI